MGRGTKFLLAGPLQTSGRDYERLPKTVTELHFITFTCLLLHKSMTPIAISS